MSNFSLTAPCGCQILAWDEGHSTEPSTKLEPCALHKLAEELVYVMKALLNHKDHHFCLCLIHETARRAVRDGLAAIEIEDCKRAIEKAEEQR